MPTIAFATLGCRVNQYDTDSIRGLFLQAGFEEADFNGPADVYIINTCSVTQVGEKSRANSFGGPRSVMMLPRSSSPAVTPSSTRNFWHLCPKWTPSSGRTNENAS